MTQPFPIPGYSEEVARILPILLYHVPSSDLLEEQFNWLKKYSFTPVHLDEVMSYLRNPTSVPYPSGKVVLTFDDAYQHFLEVAVPLLDSNAFNFKATLCVPTGDLPLLEEDRGDPPDWTNGKGPLMNWAQVESLTGLKTSSDANLIEFVPHSITHRYYDHLEKTGDPEGELREEVRNSRAHLCSTLGLDPAAMTVYCLPGGTGWGNKAVERVLAIEGYIGALRAQYRHGDGWNRNRIPRCEPHSLDDLKRLMSRGGFCCN